MEAVQERLPEERGSVMLVLLMQRAAEEQQQLQGSDQEPDLAPGDKRVCGYFLALVRKSHTDKPDMCTNTAACSSEVLPSEKKPAACLSVSRQTDCCCQLAANHVGGRLHA